MTYMDKYIRNWIYKIKCCRSSKEIGDCIDKIYLEGFEDGGDEEAGRTRKKR